MTEIFTNERKGDIHVHHYSKSENPDDKRKKKRKPKPMKRQWYANGSTRRGKQQAPLQKIQVIQWQNFLRTK